MAKVRKEDQPISEATARQMFDWHAGPLKMPIKTANKKAGVSYRQGDTQLWNNPDRMAELWHKVETSGHASIEICALVFPLLVKRLQDKKETDNIKTIELSKLYEAHHKLSQNFLEYQKPPQPAGSGGDVDPKSTIELQKFMTGILSKATDAEVSPRTPIEFDDNAIDMD